MPLYEYQCGRCGRFELIRKFSDAPLTVCPTCGEPVTKLFSAPAIQFKGTGWYITDYARKSGGGSTSEGKDKAGSKESGGGKDAGASDSGSAKDGSSKESSSKESSSKESSSKESSTKDSSSKGSSSAGSGSK